MNSTAVTVLDAGPLIHLDALGCPDLLEGLGQMLIPAAVVEEVERHRSGLRWEATPSLHVLRARLPLPGVVAELNRELCLQAGELQALALALDRVLAELP